MPLLGSSLGPVCAATLLFTLTELKIFTLNADLAALGSAGHIGGDRLPRPIRSFPQAGEDPLRN